MESASRNHSIHQTKLELAANTEKRAAKRLAQVKEETKKAMQLDDQASAQVLHRLASTYRTLELATTAHELDLWCKECGCVHTADVVAE